MLAVENKKRIEKGDFPKHHYLRRTLRVFEKEFKDLLIIHKLDACNIAEVEMLIDRWKENFKLRYTRDSYSDPDDDRMKISLPNNDDFLVRPYRCLLHRFYKINDFYYNFGFVAYISNEIVGFLFLGRTSDDCVALYANLAMPDYQGLPYYLLYIVLKEIHNLDIGFVNLGGQETNSLKLFFSKFAPVPLNNTEDITYEGEYIPRGII